MSACMCIHTNVHTYIHSIQTYIHRYIQCKHTYIQSEHTYIQCKTRRDHSEILSVKLCFKETFTISLPLPLLIKTRNCQEDYQKKNGVKSIWFWSTATIQRYHSSKSMKLEVFSELYLRKYNSPLSIKMNCPWWGVGPVEDGQLQVTQQFITRKTSTSYYKTPSKSSFPITITKCLLTQETHSSSP